MRWVTVLMLVLFTSCHSTSEPKSKTQSSDLPPLSQSTWRTQTQPTTPGGLPMRVRPVPPIALTNEYSSIQGKWDLARIECADGTTPQMSESDYVFAQHYHQTRPTHHRQAGLLDMRARVEFTVNLRTIRSTVYMSNDSADMNFSDSPIELPQNQARELRDRMSLDPITNREVTFRTLTQTNVEICASGCEIQEHWIKNP